MPGCEYAESLGWSASASVEDIKRVVGIASGDFAQTE